MVLEKFHRLFAPIADARVRATWQKISTCKLDSYKIYGFISAFKEIFMNHQSISVITFEIQA
jgi:hypothetical protein